MAGTINLLSKVAPRLDQRFALTSKTNSYASNDFDFVGVKSLEILTADLISTKAYNRSGDNARFGTLEDLGDTKQTLTMGVDNCFNFSIDAGNAAEQFNLKQAAKQMKVQWDEVVTPEIDAYRLNAWATGHGLSSGKSVQTNSTPAALAKNTIVENIFEASAALSDKKVPMNNRVLFISELDFVKFKLSDIVIGGNQLNAQAVEQGYKGKIDGITVVTVPSTYMPANVGFILKYKDATVDPIKIKNLRVHKNPMGVDGDVVECRYMYDSFVRDARCDGIYVYKTA